MAQNRSDNIQVNAPKAIDNKWGVFSSGKWRPFDDVAEFNALQPLVIQYDTQMFWVRNVEDANKADLYAVRADKTKYKLLDDIDVRDLTARVDALEIGLATEIQDRIDAVSLESAQRSAADFTKADKTSIVTNQKIIYADANWNPSHTVYTFTVPSPSIGSYEIFSNSLGRYLLTENGEIVKTINGFTLTNAVTSGEVLFLIGATGTLVNYLTKEEEHNVPFVTSGIGLEPNFDFANSNLIINKLYVSIRELNSRLIIGVSNVVVPLPSLGFNFLFVKKTTPYSVIAIPFDSPSLNTYLASTDQVLFCVCDPSNKMVSMNGSYKIEGALYGITIHYEASVFGDTGAPVNFDFLNNQVIFKKSYVLPKYLKGAFRSYTINPVTVPLVSGKNGFHYIFAKTTAVTTFEVLSFDNPNVQIFKEDPNYYSVGFFYRLGQSVEFNGMYEVNGKPFGITSGTGGDYSIVTDRAVYANKLFLFDDEGLPMFKDSLFVDPSSSSKVNVSIINNYSGTNWNRKDIINPTLLNASEFGSNIDLAIQQTYNKSIEVKKTISIRKANKASKVGSSFNILMFGDSLTQGNNGTFSSPVYQVKTRLAAMGITANMVGSFNIESPDTPTPSGTGLYRCEGRGFWQYLNFVGASNRPYTNVITPKFTGGGSTKFENPFLRLANTTDKNDHPTWCFRNTGSKVELDYFSDPDKTGNFYIFDFANYLSVQAIPIPSVITLALGTNDWQDGFPSDMSRSILSCQIMISKIREALPTARIIVNIANSLPISRNDWTSSYAPLAEQITKMVETIFSSDANIHTFAMFGHCSRWGAYRSLTNNGNVTPNNNFNSYTIDDNVHILDIPTGEGMDAYMKSFLPAIVYSI